MFEKFIAQKTSNGYLLIDKDSQMDCNYLKFYETDIIKIGKFVEQLNYLSNLEYAMEEMYKTKLKDEDVNKLKNIIIEEIYGKVM